MTEQSVKIEQKETRMLTDLMEKNEKTLTLCRSSMTILCSKMERTETMTVRI